MPDTSLRRPAPAGGWRRDAAAARALSRATVRSWAALVRRHVGGAPDGSGRAGGARDRVRLVVVAVLLLAGLWGAGLLSFLSRVATPGLHQALPGGGGPAAPLLVGALVQGAAVTAAAVVLVLVILLPPRSGLTLTALAAGASRRAVVLGQSAPLLVAAVLAGVGGQLGIIAWLATAVPPATRPTVVLATVALVVAAPLLVLAGSMAGQALGRRVAPSEVATRMLGLLAASLPLLALTVDLLRSAAAGRPPAAVRALLQLPGLTAGTARLGPALAALAVLVASAGLALLLTAAATPTGADSALHVVVRLPRTGQRVDAQAAVARELVLWLRHPVVQLGLALWLLVLAAALVLTRLTDGLSGAAALGLVALLSLTAETAYGRTRPWHWVHAASPAPRLGWFTPKAVAAALPAVGAAPVLVVGLLPVADWAAGLAAVAVLGLLFAAGALLAGTLLPFSEAAPGSMALTSLTSVVLGAGVMYAEGKLVGADRPAALTLAVQALAAAAFVALARWRASAASAEVAA